jgi:predicted metal-binding membrane protein
MWWAMMGVMMLPVTLPWFRGLSKLTDGMRPLLAFGAGYFSIWLLFSLAAAAGQVALGSLGLLDGRGALGATAGGVLLVAAGLYQLSPAKTACLRHCRSPMSFFLSRWDDGPVGTLRLGVSHGLFCLGCCWALMLLAFVFGVMSLAWMAVLMALVVAENVGRRGLALSRWAGVGLIVAGVASLASSGLGA